MRARKAILDWVTPQTVKIGRPVVCEQKKESHPSNSIRQHLRSSCQEASGSGPSSDVPPARCQGVGHPRCAHCVRRGDPLGEPGFHSSLFDRVYTDVCLC